MTDDETIAPAFSIRSLLDPGCFPHAAEGVELIETHISWVLLAGDYAYKLKKPVDLGFLDFTTLERRAHFCAEEIRINRRLAPELYLDVATLRRDGSSLSFGDEGEIVEYAVRMRRFDQDQQLDRCLQRGELGTADIDEISRLIGAFHESAPVAPPDSDWGSPEAVARPVRENFSHLGPALGTGRRGEAARRLQDWSETAFPRLEPVFRQRRAAGRVRECHGDLHLRNMARAHGRIVAFDGIEFDPALRWIDVMSDSAFLMMDLESRGSRGLAWRYLNGWLNVTGDFDGLSLLRWYLVYRHMVRAKVDAIRLGQPDLDPAEADRQRARIDSHLGLALHVGAGPEPGLIIACGVSGSGKSWIAERLAERLPAVWLRSDVERKRLFGMAPTDRPPPERLDEIYGAGSTRRTYARLAELAGGVLGAGHKVIADATYLEESERRGLLDMAARRQIPAIVLACDAPADVLERRVRRRRDEGRDPSDAGLAVLHRQLARRRPFGPSEPVLTVITDDGPDLDDLTYRLLKEMGGARS